MVRGRRADDTSYYIDRGLAYRIEMPDRNAHIISLGRIIGDRWVHSFFAPNDVCDQADNARYKHGSYQSQSVADIHESGPDRFAPLLALVFQEGEELSRVN